MNLQVVQCTCKIREELVAKIVGPSEPPGKGGFRLDPDLPQRLGLGQVWGLGLGFRVKNLRYFLSFSLSLALSLSLSLSLLLSPIYPKPSARNPKPPVSAPPPSFPSRPPSTSPALQAASTAGGCRWACRGNSSRRYSPGAGV